MEQKSLGDELWDAAWSLGKTVLICAVVVGAFYLVFWFFLQDRYYNVQNELDDINRDTIASGEAFDDAVTLLDYDNAFETYQEYKALCEKLRIELNNAPQDAVSTTKFTTLATNVKTCQKNISIMSDKLTLLRVGKPLLG